MVIRTSKYLKNFALLGIVLILIPAFQNCSFVEGTSGSGTVLNESTHYANGEPYGGKLTIPYQNSAQVSGYQSQPIEGLRYYRAGSQLMCSAQAALEPAALSYSAGTFRSEPVCSQDSVAVSNVDFRGYNSTIAIYAGLMFETQGDGRCVGSEYCKPVLVCRSPLTDASGIDVIVRENRRYPEVPAGKSLDLNFYLRELPRELSFSRVDQGRATYFDEDGTLRHAASGEPRFDHDPETKEFLGLLIEGAVTNHMRKSEDLAAQSSSLTISRDQWQAPDGKMTADIVAADALVANPPKLRYPSLAGTNEFWTFSVFAKVMGDEQAKPKITMSFANPNGGSRAADDYFIQTLPDGWMRISVTGRNGRDLVRDIELSLGLEGPAASGTRISYWGLQLEQSRFSTSYVPTTTSPASRGQDMITLANGSWFDNVQGSFLFEWRLNHLEPYGSQHLFMSENNRLRAEISSTKQFFVYLMDGKVEPASQVMARTFYRSAVVYSDNQLVAFQDGTASGRSTMNRPISSETAFFLGRDPIRNQPLYGHIRRISYWPKALTDGQMLDMTQSSRYTSSYSVTMSVGERDANQFLQSETTLFSVDRESDGTTQTFSSSVYDFEVQIGGTDGSVRALLPTGPRSANLNCTVVRE